ncbi:hypothetical protein [Desulfobulbus propionicus]
MIKLNTVLKLGGLALCAALTWFPGHAAAAGQGRDSQRAQLEAAYRFLISDRDQGGILYTASTGKLRGKRLPLSFYDTAAYWGEYVCANQDCAVVDVYDPQTFTLLPRPSRAGELQTERVNTHNGANIYDSGTWQIALMLGQTRNRFQLPSDREAYALVSNQNLLLQQGHFGDSPHPTASQLRGVTAGSVFVYNQRRITDPQQAYAFRMVPRHWLAQDPFAGTPYAHLLDAVGLPPFTTDYRPGLISWTDWKPITGENGWAFLIGPLQAAQLHYQVDGPDGYVPLHDMALDNALKILPTFAAMQSSLGGVYYAPAGTVANQGTELVDPSFISVENTISVYAGVRLLAHVLRTTLTRQPDISADDRHRLEQGLRLCEAMQQGGTIDGRTTRGLLSFFRHQAWREGEFVQGGWTDKPGSAQPWQPSTGTKAVDVNTWGVAALGASTIDQWFGFGAAHANWQWVKSWGGYGMGDTLWGVGFSNQDGNGLDQAGHYRQGVLSAEWSFGAITMVRGLIAYYRQFSGNNDQNIQARKFVTMLQNDEQSMLLAMDRLQLHTYSQTPFPGKPDRFDSLISLPTNPTLYASRRFFIPFGWYANPLPSTCATAWKIMVANRFNPFQVQENNGSRE